MADDALPIPVEPGPEMSRLEQECAAAATRWDAIVHGDVQNPRGLSRGEFIAAHLASHFTFHPHREGTTS